MKENKKFYNIIFGIGVICGIFNACVNYNDLGEMFAWISATSYAITSLTLINQNKR